MLLPHAAAAQRVRPRRAGPRVRDRAAGRLLTSPLAFLLAGICDVLLYALAAVRRRGR